MPGNAEGFKATKPPAVPEAPQSLPAAVARAGGRLSLVGWALLGTLLAALYISVLSDLVALWRGEAAYSNGPLIPLIATYLIWQKRKTLGAVPRQPCLAAWPFLLGGLLLLVVGRLAFEVHATTLSFMVVLGALLAMVGGLRLLRAVVFPLAYLFFMVPLPWAVYFAAGDPLQVTTAVVASQLAASLGIPLLQEGTLIYLPTVTLEVEAACSGVRTTLALLPLAVAFGYLMVRRPWARVLLVASAAPIAIPVNILRVAEIIVQASLFPQNVTGYALHLYSSWIPTVLGLPMLFMVGGLVQRAERHWSSESPS